MKQIINNCLKNNHLSKLCVLVDMIFKQKCLLCEAKLASLSPNKHAVCTACLNDYLGIHMRLACNMA